MKKNLLKLMSLFMAFSIMLTSCTKHAQIADAIDKVRLVEINLQMLNSLEKTWDATQVSNANLESVIETLNKQYLSEHGEIIIDYGQFMEAYEHYKPYMTESTDQKSIFDIFKEEGKLSSSQYELLAELDKKMLNIDDDNIALEALNDFETQVREHPTLNTDEKNQLLIFNEGVKAQYAFYATIDDAEKSPCTDCLNKKKWKIFGWGAAFLVVGLVICAATGAVFVLCAAGIGVGWGAEITAHCPMCIGL